MPSVTCERVSDFNIALEGETAEVGTLGCQGRRKRGVRFQLLAQSALCNYWPGAELPGDTENAEFGTVGASVAGLAQLRGSVVSRRWKRLAGSRGKSSLLSYQIFLGKPRKSARGARAEDRCRYLDRGRRREMTLDPIGANRY